MTAATIQQAAEATGWSPRMLRYVEELGLVAPTRSAAGYRLYGPGQIARLRSLRRLLDEHDLELGDVAVALRLRREPELAGALAAWFEDDAPPAPVPAPDGDWLAFEQAKHQQLLTDVTPEEKRAV